MDENQRKDTIASVIRMRSDAKLDPVPENELMFMSDENLLSLFERSKALCAKPEEEKPKVPVSILLGIGGIIVMIAVLGFALSAFGNNDSAGGNNAPYAEVSSESGENVFSPELSPSAQMPQIQFSFGPSVKEDGSIEFAFANYGDDITFFDLYIDEAVSDYTIVEGSLPLASSESLKFYVSQNLCEGSHEVRLCVFEECQIIQISEEQCSGSSE